MGYEWPSSLLHSINLIITINRINSSLGRMTESIPNFYYTNLDLNLHYEFLDQVPRQHFNPFPNLITKMEPKTKTQKEKRKEKKAIAKTSEVSQLYRSSLQL